MKLQTILHRQKQWHFLYVLFNFYIFFYFLVKFEDVYLLECIT